MGGDLTHGTQPNTFYMGLVGEQQLLFKKKKFYGGAGN